MTAKWNSDAKSEESQNEQWQKPDVSESHLIKYLHPPTHTHTHNPVHITLGAPVWTYSPNSTLTERQEKSCRRGTCFSLHIIKPDHFHHAEPVSSQPETLADSQEAHAALCPEHSAFHGLGFWPVQRQAAVMLRFGSHLLLESLFGHHQPDLQKFGSLPSLRIHSPVCLSKIPVRITVNSYYESVSSIKL